MGQQFACATAAGGTGLGADRNDLALGITPAGVSAPDWYRKLISVPTLPATVQDLGLLFQPNLETLYALKPDTIVITPQHALLKPALAQVAPLVTLPAHGLSAFISATQQLGIVLKREPQAAALIAGLSQRIIRARGYAQKLLQPVLFASPVDALHLRLYTAGSLPGDVLAACGMRNAWRASGGAEGKRPGGAHPYRHPRCPTDPAGRGGSA